MLVIGLDVGTTGTKAVVADEKGRILSGAYKEYELITEGGGKVSQKALDWWDATIYTIKKATEELSEEQRADIRAIGLSTQGASMLACDKEGRPLCDVITWMDSRSTAEVAELDEKIGTEEVYKKCGWPLSPAGDASKILWLKKNLPDVFEKADCFPSTIEFVNFHLTGKFVTDPTNAAIRQLFNIETSEWDSDILSAIGITEDKLPKVLPVGALVGNLTKSAAEKLSLSTDVKVFMGAHDQYCASLGCGAVNVGDMLLATGTAWVVLGVTKELLYTDNHICPGIHPAGNFGAMASLVSAGSALKWYKNIIGESYRDIDFNAKERTKNAEDLFVMPYVAGAGFPHNKPEIGGSMVGFTLRHDKFDIALALMEGVAFEAKCVLDEFASKGMKIEKLMMTGGAASSKLWSEIVGYVTGCEIFLMDEPETCCVGASMIAFTGLGVFADFAQCRGSMVKCHKLELSDTSLFDHYSTKYSKYRELQSKIINM